MKHIVCGQCGASWIAPDMFSDDLRESVAAWVRAGNSITAMRYIHANAPLDFSDAQAIVLHVTKEPRTCHRCSYPLVGEATAHCPFCQAINYDW